MFSLPTRVFLTREGAPLPTPRTRSRGADIVLVFENSGSRSFPPEYRAFLQDVYQRAKPFLDAVFGTPSVGGQVRVSNYDADIGERDAVAGGYYLPNNGSGQQEIRFPVYADIVGFKFEVTAVNFVHTLLLAYMGPASFGTDAFDEGLVRAATMRIARTTAAMPATLDPELVEGVLQSTYDISSFYDWNNQRALGGPKFIAPNLRPLPLPLGGSVGGLYLLRYQMAGTAWQKVLVEYPAFAAELTSTFYANPANYRTVAQQVMLCQTVLSRFGQGRVEGLTFSDWFRRQSILETRISVGPKVLVQPFPIEDGLGGSDFGVFGVQAHYFSTEANGNESLLTGIVYPVFWTPEFFRLFTSVQDERLDLNGGYGAVAPNFPGDLFSNEAYRVAVDIPVQDRIARCYLPAGAIATAARPNPNTFYGTISGGPLTGTYRVKIDFPSGTLDGIPVTNLAFGTQPPSGFLQPGVCTVTVTRNGQTVLTRRVNKGPGPLGVDLRIGGDGSMALPGGLKRGLTAIGLPVDPYAGSAAEVLGLPENETQVARWNGSRNRYEFFPDCGPMSQGLGFFVRSEVAKAVDIPGRAMANTPIAVALRPGWNLVANPLNETIPPGQIRVAVAANSPTSFNEARGVSLGTEFFSFTPGAPDTASGMPEGGTLTPATTFQPGQAYFVRVFAAEGATLLFMPSSASTSSREPRATTPSPVAWEMRAGLTGPEGASEVRIGQARAATRGFDREFDTELPPSPGGFQASVSSPALFRDIRKHLAQDTYRVRFDGLRPGQIYTVRLEVLRGTPGSYTLLDASSKARRKFSGNGTYTFRALGPSRVISLAFNGARL